MTNSDITGIIERIFSYVEILPLLSGDIVLLLILYFSCTIQISFNTTLHLDHDKKKDIDIIVTPQKQTDIKINTTKSILI